MSASSLRLPSIIAHPFERFGCVVAAAIAGGAGGALKQRVQRAAIPVARTAGAAFARLGAPLLFLVVGGVGHARSP